MRPAPWRRRTQGPPVLAVHGFEGYGAKDCAAEFSVLRAALARRLLAVGFYTGDTGADVLVPGEPVTTDTPITVVGERLAALLRAFEEPPDLVAHSMGGLVVATALRSLPDDAVRRVVMPGVPFTGLPSAAGADVAQCQEMTPGSDFLGALHSRGVRADLCVGSEADEAVPIDSALALPDARRRRLPASLNIRHGDLLTHPRAVSAVVAALV